MNRNWIVVGALLAVFSIGGYFIYQFHVLGDFKVKLIGQRIIQTTATRVQVELTLQVTNDSDLDVVINSYDVDLTVNNNFVSKLTSNMSQLIRSKGASDFKLMLDFNPQLVLKQALNLDFLKSLISSKESINIGLTGTASIMNGLKNIPINVQTKLSGI